MRGLFFLSMLMLAGPVEAGELVVVMTNGKGAAIRNAVVTLYPAGRPAPLAAAKTNYQIMQKDFQFSPFVLVVPQGAQVAFPNLDPVRHHVYSFSPAKSFELKLYAKEHNRSVRFDKAGVVPLGCNIHDGMSAFVNVVDTGLSGQSDASGRVTFANVPAGAVVARIWHPYLRAPGNQIELRWSVPATGRQVQPLSLNLRQPPAPSVSY
jgi:plastocyanin